MKKKSFLSKQIELGTHTSAKALHSPNTFPLLIIFTSFLSFRSDRRGAVRFPETKRCHKTHTLPGQPSVTFHLPSRDKAAEIPPVPGLYGLPASKCSRTTFLASHIQNHILATFFSHLTFNLVHIIFFYWRKLYFKAAHSGFEPHFLPLTQWYVAINSHGFFLFCSQSW